LLPTIGYCCSHGIHCCVRPQPLIDKDIKVKGNKQKPNKARPAETEADSELQPKTTTSCPAFANTFVQATPAVGALNFQISSKDKASFLLFIKNNKKCKRMKFRLNR